MLRRARRLLGEVGSLSMRIIDDAAALPSASAYAQTFGSMGELYRRLGYTPTYKQALAMKQMTGRGRWV